MALETWHWTPQPSHDSPMRSPRASTLVYRRGLLTVWYDRMRAIGNDRHRQFANPTARLLPLSTPRLRSHPNSDQTAELTPLKAWLLPNTPRKRRRWLTAALRRALPRRRVPRRHRPPQTTPSRLLPLVPLLLLFPRARRGTQKRRSTTIARTNDHSTSARDAPRRRRNRRQRRDRAVTMALAATTIPGSTLMATVPLGRPAQQVAERARARAAGRTGRGPRAAKAVAGGAVEVEAVAAAATSER
ncbi:unnamed protein product, partial [Scytosiphon promiscuus]